jgi:hypothetical protein
MANGFNEFSPASPRNFSPNTGGPAPFQSAPANGLNFVGMQNAVAIHSQTQDGGELVALAAVEIFAQSQGVFDYNVDVCFADGTTAKTVRLRAVLIPGGQSFNDLGGFTQSAGSPKIENPIYGSTAVVAADFNDRISIVTIAQLNQDSTGLSADGLLYGAEGPAKVGTPPISTMPGAIILWDQEIDTLTGQLSNGDNAFHAHGRAGFVNPLNQATGAGGGYFAILVLELVSTSSEAGDVITFGSCSMGLAEVG